MALTKRERLIAIGVGAAVGLYLLDSVVIAPYAERLNALDRDTQAATSEMNDRNATFDRQHELNKVWTAMTRGGLQDDAGAAESQALKATLDWAGRAGVAVTALKPDRTTDEAPFQIISFHATAAGRTPALAELLWDIETATIPVRLTDLSVTPAKEGTDQLTVQFGVSTLCQPKVDPAKAAAANAGGNS